MITEGVITSLLTFLSGATVLKIAEAYFARGKSRDDDLVLFRRELREENRELRAALDACQQRCADAQAEVRVLRREVSALQLQLGQQHGRSTSRRSIDDTTGSATPDEI